MSYEGRGQGVWVDADLLVGCIAVVASLSFDVYQPGVQTASEPLFLRAISKMTSDSHKSTSC